MHFEIEEEAYKQLVDALSGVALLVVAGACCWLSYYFDTPYPLFFAGWFTRSAWTRTQQ